MTDIPGSYVPPSRGILWPRLVVKYSLFETYLFLLTSCNVTCLNEDNTMLAMAVFLLFAYMYDTSVDLLILHVHTYFYIYRYIQVPCRGYPNT